MTKQVSLSNWAVDKTNDFFRIAGQDNFVKKGGKATVRALSNAALTVAATVETVVLALLTVLSAATYLISKKPFQSLAGRTQAAATGAKAAAKGVFGYEMKKEKTAETTATSYTQKVKENYGKIAGTIAATAFLYVVVNYAKGYFSGVEALESPIKNLICPVNSDFWGISSKAPESLIASLSKNVYDIVQGTNGSTCPPLSQVSFA